MLFQNIYYVDLWRRSVVFSVSVLSKNILLLSGFLVPLYNVWWIDGTHLVLALLYWNFDVFRIKLFGQLFTTGRNFINYVGLSGCDPLLLLHVCMWGSIVGLMG